MEGLSHEGSHLRVAPAIRVSDSNERTDERTDVAPNNDAHIMSPSATCGRVQSDDVVGLGEVIASGFIHSGKRFPTVRTGERAPIPYNIRAAVWLRDRGICQKCQARNPKPWELDHIIPWSAGGSDKSENLRVLCEPCNQERSNYDDRTAFARRPVTWWCHRCYADPVRWDYSEGVRCPRHVRLIGDDHSRRCNVERTAHYMRDASWHERRPVEVLSLTAWCAHCGSPGLTDVTL